MYTVTNPDLKYLRLRPCWVGWGIIHAWLKLSAEAHLNIEYDVLELTQQTEKQPYFIQRDNFTELFKDISSDANASFFFLLVKTDLF